MNKLTNEQMDQIIKAKFKDDNTIPDKVNSVFVKFKSKLYNDQLRKKSVVLNETKEIEKPTKDNINNETKFKNTNGAKGKIIKVDFYKRINRILSVAAVTFTVVLIGGSVVYLNKNDNNIINNPNNPSNPTEITEYSKTNLVKNEKLEMSNEKVYKHVENKFITAYMLGKRDIGINLTSKYWNEFNTEVLSTDCYKVDGINEDISDIFIGEIGGYGLPYVFLLTENGTIQYVDLHCYTNNVFYFTATKLEGLDNVVGFEQKIRKYSYSNSDYEYVNAIRNDGLRKEIEIGMVNNWNDKESVNYNKLNEKYVQAHNSEKIIDDGKGDFSVDGITYLQVNGEQKYVYYYKDNKFYRVQRDNMSKECLASGVNGFMRDNPDGRISVSLCENYEVYSLDKNIIFKANEQIINEVSNNADLKETNDAEKTEKTEETEPSSDNIKQETEETRNETSEFSEKIIKNSDGTRSVRVYGKQFSCLEGTSARQYVYYINEKYELIRVEDAKNSVILADKVKNLRVDLSEGKIYVEQDKDGSIFQNIVDNNLLYYTK